MRWAGYSLIAIAAGAAWALARMNRDIDAAWGEIAWGDVPIIPKGMAAARENDSRGGSGLREQRPGNHTQQTRPFALGMEVL